ncbi:MAG: septation protein SpoVG family protein [Clostridia bacterium]|jgi:stage V sporulation protein G|nr:septation protein SpoVG family protein [Acutalibacteraceae bacterium]MEE0968099.1 septation protein SpoVG family protein [Clostridia bacterium]
MAAKKTGGVKAPKNDEKKIEQQTAPVDNERPQYKIPFISAKIDRLNDNPDSKIKANASVTIGNHFAVHGFKIYDGDDGKGPRVMYPATKGNDGKYYEDFHPVTKEAREALNGYILDAYEQKLEQTQDEGQSENADLDDDEEPAFEQTM